MKKMIVKSLVLALFALSVTPALAQRDSLPAEKMAYRLKSYLNLNDDQTLKIKDIYRSQGQKMRVVKQSTDNDEAKREAMKKLAAETDQQVMALLTPEQQKGYEAIKEKIKEERKERMPQGRKGGAPPAGVR